MIKMTILKKYKIILKADYKKVQLPLLNNFLEDMTKTRTHVLLYAKPLMLLVAMCFAGLIPTFGQIVVDDTKFTVEELIKDILINSSCARVENIQSRTGTDFGFNGIGYFEANGSDFEIDEGIILSTGSATSAMGPNGSEPLSEGGGIAWLGDSDLQTITNTSDLSNATYIEFDFVPFGDFISFDFLFASEEYTGTFPCEFSDVFAFILTDAAGNATNLAVVPGTNPPVPIKVTTVHPGIDLNNDGDYSDIVFDVPECEPQNSTFFNKQIPAATASAIDFNGYTKVLTASSSVTPNTQYTIKLVIADARDGQYDSAVFLKAGSFDLGGDLGEDKILANGTPGCMASSVTLDATIGNMATYTWTKDGQPLTTADGTTAMNGGAQLEVTQEGMYAVEVALDSGCIATDSIVVEFIPAPIIQGAPLNLTTCDTNSDGSALFDLTQNTPIVMGTQSAAFSVTYHLTKEDAENYTGSSTDAIIANPNSFENSVQSQEVWLRIAEPNQLCYQVVSFRLLTFSIISIPAPDNLVVCDDAIDGDDTNGSITFDLAAQQASIIAGIDASLYNVSLHETIDEATQGIAGTALPDNYANRVNPQTIYVRIENKKKPSCFSTSTFQLIVHALPTIENTVTITQCDIDTDGITDFNLTEANTLLSTNANAETFTYYTTENAAMNQVAAEEIQTPQQYSNAGNTANEVYVRVTNTEGCFRVAEVQLKAMTTQIPNTFGVTLTVCESNTPDDDPTDGIATFDLTTVDSQLLALFAVSSDLRISYYQNEADALSEQNKILNPTAYRNTTAPEMQELYVRVENGVENACVGLGKHVTLEVQPELPLSFEEDFVLCLDASGTAINLQPTAAITTDVDETTHTFQWFVGDTTDPTNQIPDETASFFTPEVAGMYTVLVTNIATTCTQTATATVIESYAPQNVTAELVSGAFSDNATVVVSTTPAIGMYEYRLDNGDWQNSNTFTRVFRGEHTVYVRDLQMCDQIATDVAFIVDYPRYFTPNGDDFNPTWGIQGSSEVQIMNIKVYDRYGKLLKDLGTAGQWDGTYNGNLLPSSEYWFTVRYIESGQTKTFTASFSLIR